MVKTITKIKAEGIALVCNQMFGFTPEVKYYDDFAEIIFNSYQKQIIRNWLKNEMSKKGKPSDIKVDVSGIVFPLIVEKSIPVIAGAAALGYVLMGKKKR